MKQRDQAEEQAFRKYVSLKLAEIYDPYSRPIIDQLTHAEHSLLKKMKQGRFNTLAKLYKLPAPSGRAIGKQTADLVKNLCFQRDIGSGKSYFLSRNEAQRAILLPYLTPKERDALNKPTHRVLGQDIIEKRIKV